MTMNLNRVTEWERGLPAPDELTPLSQSLISRELACAFNIPSLSSVSTCAVATPSSSDVLNASQSAFESLLRMRSVLLPTLESDQNRKAQAAGTSCRGTDGGRAAMAGVTRPPTEASDQHDECARVSQAERGGGTPIPGVFSSSSPGHDYGSSPGYGISPISSSFNRRPASAGADVSSLPGAPPEDREGGGGGSVALRAANLIQLKADPNEEVDSGSAMDPYESTAATMSNEEQSARTLKKPRLVWTPQLHKRFVDAVVHLGIKNAVPKTIMQLMNVDGLTRENVASHLQKYRLYLKRMQGLSNEGPSSSDHLFASTPVPPSFSASAHFLVSQHSHHHSGHPFASVPGPNLPSVIGHRVHHLPSLISSPTLPFSGVDARAGFSNLSRIPPPTSMSSERVRETYNHQPSSSPRHMLTLFPTSGT